MKKIILMVSLVAFAMVSCNRDFVVAENQGSKIEFRTAVDTRATELTLNDINEFCVTAFYEDGTQYFSEIFVLEGGFFVPESGKEYYWPSDDNLYFYAYYPCDEAFRRGVVVTEERKSIPDFTPAEDIADQLDFISAIKVTNKAASSNGVVLEFKHQLSQVEVQAKNTNKGYSVKVQAVRINNVFASGDFDFTAPVTNWSVDDAITSYEVAYSDTYVKLANAAVTLMGDSGNAMLIPQSRLAWGPEQDPAEEPSEINEHVEGDIPEGEGTPDEGGEPEDGDDVEETPAAPITATDGVYIAFQIQVESSTGSRIFPVESAGDWGWVAVPVEINWLGGYKYTYVCDFSEGLGVIAPEQNPDDDPDNPYNPGDNTVGGEVNVSVDFNSYNGSIWNNIDMETANPAEEEDNE